MRLTDKTRMELLQLSIHQLLFKYIIHLTTLLMEEAVGSFGS
jgi:hypothetical protein